MSEEENKPVVMKVKIAIGLNPIGIAPGSLLDVEIMITDEYEVIRTANSRFTEDLVKAEKLKPSAPGTIAKYSPRLQKAIIKFPGMSRDEIAKIVANDLKKITK